MKPKPMPEYRVTFERIGRNRGIVPLVTRAADGDQLAEKIHGYARPHLRSRDYDVCVDLANRCGFIVCGMVHSGGNFTIKQLST